MNYFWSFIAGAFFGAATLAAWQSPKQTTELPAAEVRQSDGSLALARTATNLNAKPAHAIPKGGKAERAIRVDIQPARADCPVCTVELTLVRMPDRMRRVVASSPTGTVMGGLDIPILPIQVEKKHPWAAGISRTLASDTWGIWLDRDFGPVRTGVEINKIKANTDHDDKHEARFKLGIRF